MLVYKFGGASVKNADGIKQLKSIIEDCEDNLIIVVSAIGKTTNKLEKVVELLLKNRSDYLKFIEEIKNVHLKIVTELLPVNSDFIITEIDAVFEKVKTNCLKYRKCGYDHLYDQVVSFGEILSTKIVSAFLSNQNVSNRWIDIREVFITDSNFREAIIDIEISKENAINMFEEHTCFITQGFIGSTKDSLITTLGREGSDYTAALLADFMDAKEVTLWKDVEGIYNSDPAIFMDAVFLEELTYQEVIELAFYGAKVIHPKTIKPLKGKQIPLFVKSFYYPKKNGTTIKEFKNKTYDVPVYIIKEDQVLLSISLKDLSFIAESHISQLFALLHDFKLKVNLLQNSAVSFSVCVDKPKGKELEELIAILQEEFRVLYNQNLKLVTIRHYNEESITRLVKSNKVLIEQRSRNTVQFVME